MRTSEERVAELHRRMGRLNRARLCRRYILTGAAACTTCLAVLVLLASGISHMASDNRGGIAASMPEGGAAGSIFAGHAALSYLVIALVAFCLGAVVTVFCFRVKQHMEKEESRDDRKH